MRAMVLEKHAKVETSPLQLIDIPEPWPKEGEIRLKVSACAVCRTDLHVIEAELSPKKLPLIPGHQIVGTVDVAGRGSKRFKEGDRVGIAWLRQTCGKCGYCQNGQENLCENSKFTGYHENGGYAEYAVVNEEFAYSLPPTLNDRELAPLLCAGIIGYRSFKKSHLSTGGTLGLFGFGSSAHVVLQLAKYRGHRVYVVSRNSEHLEMAKSLGADWVGNRAADLPRKLDGIINFTPAGETVPQALAALRAGGTLAMAGIYVTPIPSLNYETHLFHEKSLCSVTSNTRQDGNEFLAEVEKTGLIPRVTAYRLEDANRALQDLKADRIQGSAVITL